MFFTYRQTGEQAVRMIWPDKMIWPLGESRIKPALATTKNPIHLFCSVKSLRLVTVLVNS